MSGGCGSCKCATRNAEGGMGKEFDIDVSQMESQIFMQVANSAHELVLKHLGKLSFDRVIRVSCPLIVSLALLCSVTWVPCILSCHPKF